MLQNFKFFKKNYADLLVFDEMEVYNYNLPIIQHNILTEIRVPLKNYVSQILLDIYIRNIIPDRIFIDGPDSVEISRRWLETHYGKPIRHVIIMATQRNSEWNRPLQYSLFFRDDYDTNTFLMYHTCTTIQTF